MAASGAVVIGICGGYQMLGDKLIDPEGLESHTGEYEGLGLLPVQTIYRSPKTTRQVKATVSRDIPVLPGLLGKVLTGYEIHTGRVEFLHNGNAGTGQAPMSFSHTGGKSEDGAVNAAGNVFGTHLHGLFDNPAAVDAFRARLDMEPVAESYLELAERNIEDLGVSIRENLNMEYICDVLGIKNRT
jgi:adenosylcobyric acid synthase